MGLAPPWKWSCGLRRYARGILIRDQASNDALRGLQVRPKVNTLVKAWANADSAKSHFQLVSPIPLHNLSSDGRGSVEPLKLFTLLHSNRNCPGTVALTTSIASPYCNAMCPTLRSDNSQARQASTSSLVKLSSPELVRSQCLENIWQLIPSVLREIRER
jgi:hypothetical protein